MPATTQTVGYMPLVGRGYGSFAGRAEFVILDTEAPSFTRAAMVSHTVPTHRSFSGARRLFSVPESIAWAFNFRSGAHRKTASRAEQIARPASLVPTWGTP